MIIVTADVFTQYGQLLAGPKWKRWLSEKLQRTERMIHAYANDEQTVPPEVRERLAEICREQAALLLAAAAELEGDTGHSISD